MMRRLCALAAIAALSALTACGDEASDTPADTGAGSDAGSDAGADAGGTDAATPDAAGADVGTDTAIDTGADTEVPLEGYAACYPEFPESVGVDIDPLGVTVGDHCLGTAHQDFDGIERVVFLGDSITAGAGGAGGNAYRDLLTTWLQDTYPDVVVDDCSRGGAVNGDLLDSQIPSCFAEPESRRTLVVFTSGGNDVVGLAFEKAPLDQAAPVIDGIVDELRDALAWLTDPANTPGGVRIVYANVYEFTDATGVMDSCPLAGLAGLTGTWEDGVAAYARLETGYAQAALDFGVDVMFLEELFCGHGYARDNPDSPCHERAGDLWIGPDCIHPNVAGHAAIADAFQTIIADAM